MAGDLNPSSTHPPLPPTTEDIRFHHLRLLRSRRVGPSSYHRLIGEYGSANAALKALPDIAAQASVAQYEICPEPVVRAELSSGRRLGAELLIYGHDGYPSSLMELETPPPVLWCLGDTSLLHRPMISVAGARNASALGVRMATSLARDLGKRGYVTVSGLARGIDTAAHKAALETGTIAVMAGGVDIVYPAENSALATDIARRGLRLSEAPPGLQPKARHFPARNRIIAALGQACVLVEAAMRSGSMITARDAADMGRDVLCVPGHPFDARSAGCNLLLRDGATLIRGAQDVLDALSPIAPPTAPRTFDILEHGDPVDTPLSEQSIEQPAAPHVASVHELHALILGELAQGPRPLEDVISALPDGVSDLAPILSELELTGQITRHAGGHLSRSA